MDPGRPDRMSADRGLMAVEGLTEHSLAATALVEVVIVDHRVEEGIRSQGKGGDMREDKESPTSTSSPSSASDSQPFAAVLHQSSGRPTQRDQWVEPGVSLALRMLGADADAPDDSGDLKLHGCIYQFHVSPFLHFDAPLPNQLYALGGRNELQEPLATVEMFDTWHGRWVACPNMLVRRAGCSAAVLPNGNLFVIGGYDEKGIVDGLLRSCEIFDPRAQTWTAASGCLQRARWGHGCAVLGGKVYIVGGCSLRDGAPPEEDFMETLRSCEVFDPATDSWEQCSPVNTPRAGGRVVTLGGKFLAVVGGCDDVFGRSEVLATVELFDSTTDRWTLLEPQLSVPRTTAAVAALGDREILVFGGTPGTPSHTWSANSCEVYGIPEQNKRQEVEPSKEEPTRKLEAPPACSAMEGRMGCQAVAIDLPAAGKSYPLCTERCVVVVGGETVQEDELGYTRHFDTVLVYDLGTNEWRPSEAIPPIPTPRTALALCVGPGRIEGHR
mmetsp:Transcript_145842/g.466006  ORF Transcript_145842/g.466006 Transcript_145842/m.466006 type:complete len:498 (-) Transcript_145842:71-1564(-)